MGNRTFLHTTDTLPGAGSAEPAFCASVAEANNSLPPLWTIMLADSRLGTAQDFQQIFLPSVYGGIYAAREGAHQRLFAVLDFLARHPGLRDPARYRQQVAGVRDFLASLPGEAYSADLNEWFWLSDEDLSPEQHLDKFAHDIAQLWDELQEAMACDDMQAVARLIEFDPHDAARSLGFDCFIHRYFWGDERGGPSRKDFATFCAEDRPPVYDDEDDDEELEVGHGLIRFSEQGRFGLRREDGSVVLAAEYDEIAIPDGDGNQFFFIYQGGLAGTVDSSGAILLAPSIGEVFDASEGYTLVQAGKFGYLNQRGTWFREPRYDDAFPFTNGMAPVTLNGREGYLSSEGRELFGAWSECGDFNDAGTACVTVDGGENLIDRSGALLLDAPLATLTLNGELDAWVGRDHKGELVVIKPGGSPWFRGQYDDPDCLMYGGDALVARGDRLGIVPRDRATPSIALEYTDIALLYSDIYVLTDQAGKLQACGRQGELMIPARFDAYEEITRLPAPEDGPGELVEVAVGGLVGVWSIPERRQLIECACDAIILMDCGGQGWFVLRMPGGGVEIANAAGKRINQYRYNWLGAEFYGALDHDWQVGLLQVELEKCWSGGEPIDAQRAGMGIRLFADGREELELDRLLREVAAHPDPIVPLAPLVMQLPLPARAPRPTAHTIAGMGDEDACFRISQIYRDGLGVAADQPAGLRWLATAAAGGHAEAQYQYAYCLMEGEGCEQDVDTALRIFNKLAPTSQHAINCLGFIHEKRLGRRCDPAKARAYYEQAAEGGEAGLAQAQVNAGNCWLHGIGGPVDAVKALAWYEAAAFSRASPPRAAHPDAAVLAAGLYLDQARTAQGFQNKQLLYKATVLLRQALAGGDAGAALTLLRRYLGEYGGEPNLEAARKYYQQAMEDDALREEAAALGKQHRL